MIPPGLVMSWMLERLLSFLFIELRRMKYFCAWDATCIPNSIIVFCSTGCRLTMSEQSGTHSYDIPACSETVTCVGVLETTKFRDMLRQSPFPNLERPSRNKRCSSSVQGMPFRLSCSLLAGFCGRICLRHSIAPSFPLLGCIAFQLLISHGDASLVSSHCLLFVVDVSCEDCRMAQEAFNVRLTPLDGMTGSAEARYFGRGILPASIFLTSSCGISQAMRHTVLAFRHATDKALLYI